jgi:hypothetical protein
MIKKIQVIKEKIRKIRKIIEFMFIILLFPIIFV